MKKYSKIKIVPIYIQRFFLINVAFLLAYISIACFKKKASYQNKQLIYHGLIYPTPFVRRGCSYFTFFPLEDRIHTVSRRI
jgi:hypothetical protein